jgi:hypothetical protein
VSDDRDVDEERHGEALAAMQANTEVLHRIAALLEVFLRQLEAAQAKLELIARRLER